MNRFDAYCAEFFGTAVLLASVVGSGIMGENLAGGNNAVALLANSLATGATLYVLISALGPTSGAHFNPAVSLALALAGRFPRRELLPYLLLQFSGATLGVVLANLMFELPAWQWSGTERQGAHLLLSEAVATAGLLLTIVLFLRNSAHSVALGVALYITAAYWFTSSTSFANPAVSFARMFSDTFAGIAPACVPDFVLVQLATAVAIGLLLKLRSRSSPSRQPAA